MKIEVEEIDESVVTLDTYNSDLNLSIDGSRYSAHPLTKEGFAFMWAGARATHGAPKGKFCFEVKVLEHKDVSHLPADEPNPHVVRVGFSVESSTLQLGEDPLSYGYGGTGKISTNCQFKDYGTTFMTGDVILALVNMDSDPIQIGFAKNGKFLNWAYKVNKTELKGQALFPHVLTKNVSFEVNFGQKEKPYFPLPDNFKDYVFISCLSLEQRVSGTRAPKKIEDCEMIMMCGLPGAGKSVWAAEYSKKNPEKKYNVLGTNNIIDKMKVMGLPRKRNYAGRWDVLIQMATKCLNKMFEIGSKLRRNYILDQTNVYPTAQRRKMRNFEGFKRIAVVVVPSDIEYKKRCDKRDREEGKEVPDQAVLEMKANFRIPEVGDIFNDVIYTDLPRHEAEKLVASYNDEGKAAVGPPRKQFKSNDQSPGFGNNRGFDSGQGNMSYSARGGRGDHEGSRGGFRGGRGGFGGNRGSFEGNRGGFDRNRGGFEGNRGGFEGNRGGFERNRGGFDGNRGSFDGNRGGFDGNRGGFDRNRGNFERNRGGFEGNRGGFEGNRGGFEGNRGGFDRNQGGYDGNRERFDRNRGSYDGQRGGFDGGRRGYDGGSDNSRESFDSSSRGGYSGSRGSFEGNRGGYDKTRGSYNGSRGGFDRGRGGYDSNRGSYNSGRESLGHKRGLDEDSQSFDVSEGTGGYGGYSESSSGFGNNSRGFGSRGRGDFTGSRSNAQSSYGSRDFNSGSDSNSGRFSGGSFNKEPALGAYDRGGSSGSRGYRGATTRGGNTRDSYSSSRSDNSSSRGYGSGSNVTAGGNYGSDYKREPTSNFGSGYSSYQNDYSDKPQGGFRGSSDSYPRRDSSSFGTGPQGGFKKEPGIEAGGARTSRGSTRPSGRASRWSAETTQSTSYPDSSSNMPDTSAYSNYGTQVKTEPVGNTAAPRYDNYNTNSSGYSSYVPPPPSNQGFQGAQAYGYQPNVATNTVSQPWMATQPSTATNTVSQPWVATQPSTVPTQVPQVAQDQQQWSQYYPQQQSQPNQYYTQYYGQQAAAAAPTYGSAYGAK